MVLTPLRLLFFFFNDTATTEIYTLSLHDALPISRSGSWEKPDAARTSITTSWGAWTSSPALWARRWAAPAAATPAGERKSRSEERRGGEECRSRWSPYH